MAFGKSLAHRFLDMAKTCSGQIRSGFGAGVVRSPERGSGRFFPGSADRGTQWRPIIQAAMPRDRFTIPNGIMALDRMSWPKLEFQKQDKLPPPPLTVREKDGAGLGMVVNEARKTLKASQMELVRSRLKEISNTSISSSEFLQICSELSSAEQRPDTARPLVDSGTAIVLGNIVFIKSNQAAKAIEGMSQDSISPEHDPRKEELLSLERQKAEIDKLAAGQARNELWCGLVFLAAQTVASTRLTFWELSWDVMEPICFFVASYYYIACYLFFMKNSTEFSLDGFFKLRFAAKQKRLMQARNFDLSRFNELKQIFCSPAPSQPTSRSTPRSCDCLNKRNALAGYAC